MKPYGGADTLFNSLLTSTLDGGEWLTSSLCHFLPWREARYPLSRSVWRPRTVWAVFEKIPCPQPGFKPRTVQPVATLNTISKQTCRNIFQSLTTPKKPKIWSSAYHFIDCSGFVRWNKIGHIVLNKEIVLESRDTCIIQLCHLYCRSYMTMQGKGKASKHWACEH